jgi:alpha-tubulin suppressor-like RCC1 family protein
MVLGRRLQYRLRRNITTLAVIMGREVCPLAMHSHLLTRSRFVSISAGNDHMLALTSHGRTFAHPISKMANSHGQLGFRKFDIPDPSSNSKLRRPIELIPKSIVDPLARTSPFIRQAPSSPSLYPEHLSNIDDQNIRFCDRLYEVPALRDVKISQIATGGRSSFVRTITGKVLGWGANEYG